MIESLRRLREPAAIVVLAVLGVRLLLGLITFSYLQIVGTDSAASLAVARFTASDTITDAFTVVVLGLLVASCVLVEPTPHARTLTWLAVVIAGAGILLALVSSITWLVTVGGVTVVGDLFRLLIGLPISVVALVGLLRLLRGQPKPAKAARQAVGVRVDGDNSDRQQELGSGPDKPAQEDENQPTWQPDQAVGAAWHTAGEAAAGAAASGWGTPGDPGGWRPASGGPPESGRQVGRPELEERPRE